MGDIADGGQQGQPTGYGRRRADGITNEPLTMKTVTAIAGVVVAALSLAGYVNSLSTRIDLLNQKEAAYETSNDAQRAMLIADRDAWRSAMNGRQSDIERRVGQDEAIRAADMTELKSQLAALNQKVQGLCDRVDRSISRDSVGPLDR